jgi:phosphoribosylcarboxyaminoimidazole (NCAIR) mutase
MLRAAGFNESRRPEDLAKPILAFVIQAAGGSIGTPHLVVIATSFPVCGMPAAVAASSSANMLAAWEPPAAQYTLSISATG